MASYIHIPRTDVEYVDNDDITCTRLTALIKERRIPVRRGDIIGLDADDARDHNNDCFIWDGEKVIRLFYGIDEYGSVPPNIQVTDGEFHPRYWLDTVTQNTIFWLAQPILDRFRVRWDSGLRLHMATTTIAGKPYTVLIAPRKDEELQAALNGELVEPSETAAEIEADIKAGLYQFELNHYDLECIDLECQTDHVFYARRHISEDDPEDYEVDETALSAGWTPTV